MSFVQIKLLGTNLTQTKHFKSRATAQKYRNG